jgi:hypothetical protein
MSSVVKAANHFTQPGECSSQLSVADFHGQERILERCESAVRTPNRCDRSVDKASCTGRRKTRRWWFEVAAGEAVAGSKLRVRAPCPAVSKLNRPKELFFQLVGVVLVELLMGRAQVHKRGPDCFRRLSDRVEELLAGFRGAPYHGARLVVFGARKPARRYVRPGRDPAEAHCCGTFREGNEATRMLRLTQAQLCFSLSSRSARSRGTSFSWASAT